MRCKEWSKLDDSTRKILLKHLSTFPIKLGAIARELGLQVKLSSLGAGISGKIYNNDGQYVIKINRHESKERQRFTLAHEISHFILHKNIIDSTDGGIIDNVLYRSGASESIEFEANRLAADIIMPRLLLKSQLDASNEQIDDACIEELAKAFQVSKIAMEIRLTGSAS